MDIKMKLSQDRIREDRLDVARGLADKRRPAPEARTFRNIS
jgi:predicted FMN-binding regulatory protein PaiB